MDGPRVKEIVCVAESKAHSCVPRMASSHAAAGMGNSCVVAEMTHSCAATGMASSSAAARMAHPEAVVFNLLKAVAAKYHQGRAPRLTSGKADPEKKRKTNNNTLIFKLKTK